MAYTNTTLLGLNLPTTGSEPGVWGDDINLGTTTLVEISVAGTNNITYDGDVTLSVSNGSSGSSFTSTVTTSTSTGIAQYYILNLSGSRAAPRVITAPTSSRSFLITNGTTVAYTIKKSGGTGVTIAASETCIVYYNTVTADYAKAVSTVTTGVVPTTNGGTGLTSFTANGVVYASSTSALATGSALTFDGSNLGLGVTPSAWNAGVFRTFEGNSYASCIAFQTGGPSMKVGTNWYYNNSGNYVYKTTNAVSRMDYNDGYFSWYNAPSGTAGATISFTQAMTLDVSGNLALGLTSANRRLEVSGASSGETYQMRMGAGAANSVNTYDLGRSTADGYFRFYGNQSGANGYIWSGADGERARIDISGNLGLGVTPSAWQSYLAFQMNAGSILSYSTYDYRMVQNTVRTAGAWKYINNGYANAYLQDGSSGGHAWYTAPSGTAGNAISFTQAMTLSAAGGFSVGTTADPGAGAIYATGNITAYYSDARLKTVSGKIENALDKVAQLSGVYYTNNDTAKSFGYDSDEVQVGVLAQDVEAVLPEIVKAAPFDLDADGNSKSGENYKTVQYERLVPLLIEAINELQAKVKALESK